jgi:hypothetical protein
MEARPNSTVSNFLSFRQRRSHQFLRKAEYPRIASPDPQVASIPASYTGVDAQIYRRRS